MRWCGGYHRSNFAAEYTFPVRLGQIFVVPKNNEIVAPLAPLP